VVWLSWRAHIEPGPGGAAVDSALNIVGLLLCASGSAVRLLTVASVPRGTSSEGRVIITPGLNTRGVYAVVRHPLYVGNALIVLGLLCIAHTPWAWGIGLPFFALTTASIIAAEEAHLAERFGPSFRDWAARVPAFWPRLSTFEGLPRPLAWKRAIQREVNPLVAWGSAATLLLMWEWFARSQLTSTLGKRCLATLAALLVVLATNKAWKRLSPPAR
jgi:protein-S-isoprenylcysteine O-methyltransferase Ste14